jgi:hypothetical protein
MSKTQVEQNLYNKLLIAQAINYQKLGDSNIKVNNQNRINGQQSKLAVSPPIYQLFLMMKLPYVR